MPKGTTFWKFFIQKQLKVYDGGYGGKWQKKNKAYPSKNQIYDDQDLNHKAVEDSPRKDKKKTKYQQKGLNYIEYFL